MIHVFGAKEASDNLATDETVCESMDDAYPDHIDVVYHPNFVAVTGGGHACTTCGTCSSPAAVEAS